MFKKEGFKDPSCTLTKGTDGGWVVADILFAGLIGVIVDGATGTWSQTKGKGYTTTLGIAPAPVIARAAPAPQVVDAVRTPVPVQPAMQYPPDPEPMAAPVAASRCGVHEAPHVYQLDRGRPY